MDKFPIIGEGVFLDSQDELTMIERVDIYRRSVSGFLLGHDIDVEQIKKINVNERNSQLIDIFSKENGIPDTAEGIITDKFDSRVGMILIKPEILPFKSKVVEYLEGNGFEVAPLDQNYPSHKDWMNIYGYMLDRCPDTINLYIMQRSLGFQPILFQHLDASVYDSLLKSRGMTLPKDSDQDTIFDRLFCGEVNDNQPLTLRGGVSLPIMKQLGFDDMSGYASLFDPVDYFKDMGMSSNYHAYNGIHAPSNSTEKRQNLQTFLRPKDGSDA